MIAVEEEDDDEEDEDEDDKFMHVYCLKLYSIPFGPSLYLIELRCKMYMLLAIPNDTK